MRILAPTLRDGFLLAQAAQVSGFALYHSQDGGVSWSELWREDGEANEGAYDIDVRHDAVYVSSKLGIFRRDLSPSR